MKEEMPMDLESLQANADLNAHFVGKTPADIDATREVEDASAMNRELDEIGKAMRAEEGASAPDLSEKARMGTELRPVEKMSTEELKGEFRRLYQMRTALESSDIDAGFGMTREEFIQFAEARTVELQKEFRHRMSETYPGISPEGA